MLRPLQAHWLRRSARPDRRTGRSCARRGATAGGRSTARLALGVHVLAAEEIGLDVHLLDREFARDDPVMHVLVRGLKRRVWPTMQVRPVSCCLRTTASASAQLSHSGISTCTCLPASMQAIACSACIWVGVHRITASTSSRASASLKFGRAVLRAVFRGDRRGLFAGAADDRDDLDPVDFFSPSRCFSPNAPAPAECDSHVTGSRTMWPMAVLLHGMW